MPPASGYASASTPMMAMHNKPRAMKAQQALDYMISYGIALLIIVLALYVVVKLGAFNTSVAPDSCTPAPPFLCPSYAINTTGAVLMKIAQSSGSAITVTGMACSSSLSPTNASEPEYGNVHVLSYSAAPSYYPNNALANGVKIYSGASAILSAYCYEPSGAASSSLGNSFTGYIWLNYTTSAAPQSHTINMAAQFTVKYT